MGFELETGDETSRDGEDATGPGKTTRLGEAVVDWVKDRRVLWLDSSVWIATSADAVESCREGVNELFKS